ncbi:TPA: DNA repair protein RecO [bacterium]|nr:DNA repair protein RecO [bacterium]
MAIKRSKAIVIGSYPLRESDKIIVFLTRDFGKIRAVAKGVRNIKNKLCGRLELLTFGELIYFERTGKDLHSINSFDIIEPFQMLREDLLKMAYCSYIAELVQHVISEEETDPQIFDLTLSMMSMIAINNEPEIIIRAYELRLLEKMGLKPRLDSCILCSAEIDDLNPKFSVKNGGILCNKCSNSENNIFTISRGSLEVMKKMQESSLEFISRLRLSEQNRQEITKALLSFLTFHTDIKNLRSLSFLEAIKSEYRSQNSEK